MLTNNEFIMTHLVVHRAILQALISTHPDRPRLARAFELTAELKTVQALFRPITDEQQALFESERQKTLRAIRAGV